MFIYSKACGFILKGVNFLAKIEISITLQADIDVSQIFNVTGFYEVHFGGIRQKEFNKYDHVYVLFPSYSIKEIDKYKVKIVDSNINIYQKKMIVPREHLLGSYLIDGHHLNAHLLFGCLMGGRQRKYLLCPLRPSFIFIYKINKYLKSKK